MENSKIKKIILTIKIIFFYIAVIAAYNKNNIKEKLKKLTNLNSL